MVLELQAFYTLMLQVECTYVRTGFALVGFGAMHCDLLLIHPKESRCPQENFWNVLALEDGTIRCSEISVTNLIMLLNSPKCEYPNHTVAKPENFTLSFVNPASEAPRTDRYFANYAPGQ